MATTDFRTTEQRVSCLVYIEYPTNHAGKGCSDEEMNSSLPDPYTLQGNSATCTWVTRV